jgi:hypothetical protein
MNFKSVTINLLLTTLSAGVLLQTLEAQAASITFGTWEASFTVTKNPENSRFVKGNATANGNATAFTLKAFAQADPTDDPLSGFNSAITRIVLNSFIRVTPETGERNGDQVRGILSGTLTGVLGASGSNYTSSVKANANAGFASGIGAQIIMDNQGELPPSIVNQSFNEERTLTIGEQYPFNMSLEVFAQQRGSSQAISNIGGEIGGFTVNVRPVPEPLTMLASATALGFGAFFKRQHSKNPKKS